MTLTKPTVGWLRKKDKDFLLNLFLGIHIYYDVAVNLEEQGFDRKGLPLLPPFDTKELHS